MSNMQNTGSLASTTAIPLECGRTLNTAVNTNRQSMNALN